MSGKFIVPNASDPTYGLGICARCSRKFKLAELHPDPNYPALMVCDEDTARRLLTKLVKEHRPEYTVRTRSTSRKQQYMPKYVLHQAAAQAVRATVQAAPPPLPCLCTRTRTELQPHPPPCPTSVRQPKEVTAKAKEIRGRISRVKSSLPTCHGLRGRDAVYLAYERRFGPGQVPAGMLRHIDDLAEWLNR